MTTEYWQLALLIVVGLLAGYAVYKSHQKGTTLSVSGVVDEIRTAYGPAQEFIAMVRMAVEAAEQMKRDGRLDSNSAAYTYVLDYVTRKIPAEWGITREDIDMAINSAVLASSALSKQAGKSSENVTT